MKRFRSIASLIVFAAFPFALVQACGPDFFPDIFVHQIHPDHPRDYAAGKLGVLLSTYPRADLTVAYRYMNGGTLNPTEQKGYQPTSSLAEEVGLDDSADASQTNAAANSSDYVEPTGPADIWLKTRNRYAPAQPEIHDIRQYGTVYRAGYILAGTYQNCQADAFRTAAVTLQSRSKIWGAHSTELADWIKGQDAVFSNCGSGGYAMAYPPNKPKIVALSPTPAPSNAPQLLRQDRAYQTAAAQFYTGQFANALASFRTIAQDATSPWRGIARYMVARTLIRDAFLNAKSGPDDSMAGFDLGLMKQAQQQLETIRNEQLVGIPQHAVESLLHLVQLRTEPKVRVANLSGALAGPKVDSDYAQDLQDLTWYLDAKLDPLPIRPDSSDFDFHVDRPKGDYRPLTEAQKQPGFDAAFNDVADLRSISPLVDWLITVQSPSEGAKDHAIAEWEHTRHTTWLTAAIMKASASDATAPILIEAAAHIPPTSPAWPTVEYHRIRLLIDLGHGSEARKELTAALPRVQASGSESALNLFTGLRMRSETSLNRALSDASRKILERTSEEQSSLDQCLAVMKNPKRKYDCRKDNSPVELSRDAATVLNRETPLSMLALAAQSHALPPQLRQSVANVTWVRAVLLKNESVTNAMLPLLPAKLQQQAGPGVGFRPLMAILRNPGLRPYLDDGVQRSYSYDFVESYADNWWCTDWTTDYGSDRDPIRAKSVHFLSPEERKTGEQEVRSLLALGSADEYLGSQVIAYAKAHSSDPHVPEALYLTLRMIRYGCSRGGESQEPNKPHVDQTSAIAYDIGAIMRRRYPTNPWTKKAAPYVWLGKMSN